MTQKTIPVHLYPELEAWGKLTAQVFGKLRAHAGLPPKDVPEDQAWFWTDEWQAVEREVDLELERGEYDDFEDVETLIQDLRAQV